MTVDINVDITNHWVREYLETGEAQFLGSRSGTGRIATYRTTIVESGIAIAIATASSCAQYRKGVSNVGVGTVWRHELIRVIVYDGYDGIVFKKPTVASAAHAMYVAACPWIFRLHPWCARKCRTFRGLPLTNYPRRPMACQ